MRLLPCDLRAKTEQRQYEKKPSPECPFHAACAVIFDFSAETFEKAAEVICPGDSMFYSNVHLKVCEGCGTLWFRAQNSGAVYCFSCEQKFRSFSRPAKRRSGRPRKHTLHVVKGGAQ